MTEVVNPDPVTEGQVPAEVVTPAAPVDPKPGEKTDSALLLKSLQEEREKRRQAEAELEAERIRNSQPRAEVVSDEGRLLDTKISALEAEIRVTREEREMASVQSKFPALADKRDEFEQFRADNPGMRLETAAKAFLAENDLLTPITPRKGLEPVSGGGRTPIPQDGMSAAEADELRSSNYNEYARRIKNGTLKIRS